MKIYSDDTNLPYRSTKLKAIDSKRDIDGTLARYGITQVMWTWDLEKNKVELVFQLSEEFRGTSIHALIRLHPPTIWMKKRRNRAEEIDWKLSMRIFYWFIKNQLAMTYTMGSEKILAFLPHVVVNEEETLGDVIVPRLDQVKNLKALPFKQDTEPKRKIVDVTVED